ncbi:MAG: YHS domain-containing (seleno)protein [Pseudomonadota bacterium]
MSFASTLKGAFVAAALFVAPTFAIAGPQFIDNSGYAASGYDVVAYRSLEQAPIGQAQPKAVPGKKEFTTEWNGATWAFASAENRDLFVGNPEFYAPQYDGHCAYGVSKGGKVPGNPNLWRIVDDKLYLNITPVVVGFWEEDVPGNISIAEGNWPGIESKDSPQKNAPKFDSSLAPQG